MSKKVLINEEQLRSILQEENLSKEEVTKIVRNLIKQDKDFESRVKNVAADVVKNLFRTLWQKNGIYDHDIRQ